MIKRTIEVSRDPAHISVRQRQLVLKREGEVVATIPCEDVGMLVVDHPQTTYSHGALSTLLESDAALVVCGKNHLPLGVLLPLGEHTQVVWRIRDQIRVSTPLRKRLWQQIVRAKITAQGLNLDAGSPTRRKLQFLAREVRSGDATNSEAQAARIYWSAWMINPPHGLEAQAQAFRRLPDGVSPNCLLNYGYAIVRAAVARALVSAGLLPAIGLHHSNRSNSFCLADDLMEPLRPMVDSTVRELYFGGQTELDQPTKAVLLSLLTQEVQASRNDSASGPLMVMLHRYVASLVKCFQGEERELKIPVSRQRDGACDSKVFDDADVDADFDSSRG